MTYQHAGAPALVCALGSAARGRALYANRPSLQRLVSRLRLSQAPAFNPVSNTHCPGRHLFEQRAYDARAVTLNDAARITAAQCETADPQRRNARPQTHGAGRKNATEQACRGEVRGHDSTTAGADGMHFIDDRFRPGIANTIPPRPALSN